MPEKLKSELIVLYGFVKSISPPFSCGCVEKSVDDLIKLATVLSCNSICFISFTCIRITVVNVHSTVHEGVLIKMGVVILKFSVCSVRTL